MINRVVFRVFKKIHDIRHFKRDQRFRCEIASSPAIKSRKSSMCANTWRPKIKSAAPHSARIFLALAALKNSLRVGIAVASADPAGLYPGVAPAPAAAAVHVRLHVHRGHRLVRAAGQQPDQHPRAAGFPARPGHLSGAPLPAAALVIAGNMALFLLIFRREIGGRFAPALLTVELPAHPANLRYSLIVLGLIGLTYVLAGWEQWPLSLVALAGSALLAIGARFGGACVRHLDNRLCRPVRGN